MRAAFSVRESAGAHAPAIPPLDSRSGCLRRCHLQTVQVIDSTLSMSGSREYRTLVFTEHFQPVREVRSMILPRLGADAEIRTQEGRTQLGHQFLASVGVIAKAFASELPIEATLMFRPVQIMPMSA